MDEEQPDEPVVQWSIFRANDDEANRAAEKAIEAQLAREMEGQTDPAVVRRDCAFCGRERSRKDDNHGPECPYWTIGPGSLRRG